MNKTLAIMLLLTPPLLAACGGNGGGNGEVLEELKALRGEVQSLSNEMAELKKRPAAPQPAAPAPAPRPTVATAGYPVKGNADAPITVVEFSDYQCPFCGKHSAQTMPRIEREYVDTGKVRYIFMDLPLPFHRHAVEAAEAAHCAGDQGKYWEMHSTLFAAQARILPHNFEGFAKEIGLDMGAFEACMTSDRHLAKVETAKQIAGASGATGTPSFVIGPTRPDGRITGELVVGAKHFNVFASKINALLAQ